MGSRVEGGYSVDLLWVAELERLIGGLFRTFRALKFRVVTRLPVFGEGTRISALVPVSGNPDLKCVKLSKLVKGEFPALWYS